jgi:hypothetical protein
VAVSEAGEKVEREAESVRVSLRDSVNAIWTELRSQTVQVNGSSKSNPNRSVRVPLQPCDETGRSHAHVYACARVCEYARVGLSVCRDMAPMSFKRKSQGLKTATVAPAHPEAGNEEALLRVRDATSPEVAESSGREEARDPRRDRTEDDRQCANNVG